MQIMGLKRQTNSRNGLTPFFTLTKISLGKISPLKVPYYMKCIRHVIIIQIGQIRINFVFVLIYVS